MIPSDPQFIYLILVLPSLFGLTMIGDGLFKLAHDDTRGLINLILGFVFIGVAVFTYFFFSMYLNQQL